MSAVTGLDLLLSVSRLLIVLVCIIRVTTMSERTRELHAWGYIVLCVGAFWKFMVFLPGLDPFAGVQDANDINEEIGSLLISVGTLLIIVEATCPLSQLSLWSHSLPKRRQGDH